MKTLSFTMMHFSIALTVAYALTGDWVIGGAIALIEPAVNVVGYWVHERLWQRREQGAARAREPAMRQVLVG